MSKTLDEINIIADYMKAPISINDIAKKYDLCTVTISRVLRRNKIPLWTRQDLFQGDMIVDYFENINTEIKAYFLGLFSADGCVFITPSSKLFNIQLQEKDGYMIELIKNVIKFPRKIVVDKRDMSKSISVINNRFVDSLINHSVCSGKFNRFMPDIRDDLIHHYIRGLFDGDGSILIRKTHSYRTSLRCTVVILAYLKQLCQIQEYLERTLNVSHLKFCNEGKDIFSLRFSSKKDFLSITNFMYKDATVYLQRKYDKYIKAISYLS